MTEIWNLSAICRCCHVDGNFKSLELAYQHQNAMEIYSVMLEETFGLSILKPPKYKSYSICDDCIEKLRNAAHFRQQIISCEEKFKEYLLNEEALNPIVKVEIELNNDDENSHNKTSLGVPELNIKQENDYEDHDYDDIAETGGIKTEIFKQEAPHIQQKERSEISIEICSSEDSEIDMNDDTTTITEDKLTLNTLMPQKSKRKYYNAYSNFKAWMKLNKTDTLSEPVLLTYFNELAKDKRPSTLYAIYSMLKCTIALEDNVDIGKYCKLLAFLRRKSDGFTSKTSKTLTKEEIKQFLNEAPDERFLAMKVALVLGITGALTSTELYHITTKDINHYDDSLVVTVKDTNTKNNRLFEVRDEYAEIVKKYINLRPVDAIKDNLFLSYKNGECSKNVIGRHKITLMPKEVATFLKLSQANNYTGHCFRKTAATLRMGSEVNLSIPEIPETPEMESHKVYIKRENETENEGIVINKKVKLEPNLEATTSKMGCEISTKKILGL